MVIMIDMLMMIKCKKDTIFVYHAIILYTADTKVPDRWLQWESYRKTSNLSRTQSQKLKCFSSRLAVVFAQSIEAKCWVENEDVVGAAPTGDAPTTSELSTILLPTMVRLLLEVLR